MHKAFLKYWNRCEQKYPRKDLILIRLGLHNAWKAGRRYGQLEHRQYCRRDWMSESKAITTAAVEQVRRAIEERPEVIVDLIKKHNRLYKEERDDT